MVIVVVVCLAIIAVAGVGIGFYLSRKKNAIPEVKYEVLALKDVIQFFKRSEMVAILRQSTDIVGVVIREKSTADEHKFVLCLYNKKENVIEQSQHSTIFIAKQVQDDLLSLFGDKEMIVLQ